MTTRLDERRGKLDVVLTNISLGLGVGQDFIGDRILPPLPVPTSKVKIPVWGDEAFRVTDDRVGDYSEPDKLDIKLGTTLIEVEGHAKMAPFSAADQHESAQGPLKVDLETELLETIKSQMALSREKLQADLVTNTNVYDATHKVDLNGVSHLWSDANVNPLEDIIPMVENIIPNDSMQTPGLFWLGQQVKMPLLTNPFIVNAIFGTVGPRKGIVTLAQFAELIGVKTVLVGKAIGRDENGNVTKLWGKNAGVVYESQNSGKRIQMFGRTVEWTIFNGGSEKIFRIQDDIPGAGGVTWIKRGSYYSPMITSKNAGALFYNAVA